MENIIKHAAGQIDEGKSFESEEATFSTSVTYNSDLHKPAGLANKTITYIVKFIRKKNKWVFEQIDIVPV
ncbi:MAG: hypothetical protein WDO19_27435 [Bacteroidota bacterium]